MASEHEPYLAVLKASYDYEPAPEADEELAIKENQILFLLERTDDDWWKVKIKLDSQDDEGASGLVPSAYVEPADQISVVKALYDYEAAQPGELSVQEDEVLIVYGKEDLWLLCQSQKPDGKAGFVPENYVEEFSGDAEGSEATPAPASSWADIVVPASPPRPEYVDPADRVARASSKVQADDIQTWAVSEIDKKGKKKKGTLGIGNGSLFFASESDKTPVQKWKTSDVEAAKSEKAKHVTIDIGGSAPINLHFHAGSKDTAEAILAKLESSRAIASAAATPAPAAAPPVVSSPSEEIERPRSSAQKAVHFDVSEPEIIPPREPSEDGGEYAHEPDEDLDHEEQHLDGAHAVALYDFAADGEDELSVHEGEELLVLERDSDEWWKVRNAQGEEGVVPASYVEMAEGAQTTTQASAPRRDPAIAAAAARAAQEAEERAEAGRQEKAAREREREEKERKKAEAEQRAKVAAAAADADRRRREQEREKQKEKERAAAAAAEDEARRKKQAQRESTSESASRSSRDRRSNGDASSTSRSSVDKRSPPPENTRVWHDRTGQFRVEAAFLGYANGKLRLHKVNGVVIEVPSEKMSTEDMRVVEKLMAKQRPASPVSRVSEDDVPLEVRRRSLVPQSSSASRTAPPKKGPTIDWFEFFLNAGCDVDDCTRYASSFERDKIDEAILPDITESTMRSLGLREGDIIRVKKAIDQRQPKRGSSQDDAKQEQLRRDEELAIQLQGEETGSRPRTQAPNLFAGPNGALKNNTPRRARPPPSKSLPPTTVDINLISTASEQIRSGTPQGSGTPVVSTPPAATPVQAPPRSSSAAVPVESGFDDDAWTNRPSSTKPLAPTPPALAPRAPSAPPAPPPPPAAPAAAPVQPPAAAPTPPAQPSSAPPAQQQQPAGSGLAKTDSDIFDQLARLSQLRVQNPPAASPQPPSVQQPVVVSPPPMSYQAGLGMGSSPAPMGQHLYSQQTGMLPPPQPPQPANGPRGPYAPIPVNQTLLQPLVPTTTGFNSFVPTRPQNTSSPFQTPPQQPSFLSAQPTGYSGPMQPLYSQPTGYTPGLMSQPTGVPGGNFGSGFNSSVPPMPTFQNNNGFGQVQSNPTGFNPAFGQMPMNNVAPPPLPTQPPVQNTSPANIFAQMKSGTFATNDTDAPQSADKYDALRPNPIPITTQPTGWGYQGMNGFQGGYGYQ